MTRLIEEEEAFKVLSAYYKHRTPEQDSALHDALSRVPSADLVNEWCTDCKEYDQTQHCCHRFTKVIRQAQEELKQNAVPVRRGHWIETEENHGFDNEVRNKALSCSICRVAFRISDYAQIEDFRYCPNCGARMNAKWKENEK